MISNNYQINSNLFRSKLDLSNLKKIEIKYGFEGFGERNNFLYINYLQRLDYDLGDMYTLTPHIKEDIEFQRYIIIKLKSGKISKVWKLS
jgi:hypothetical protein